MWNFFGHVFLCTLRSWNADEIYNQKNLYEMNHWNLTFEINDE